MWLNIYNVHLIHFRSLKCSIVNVSGPLWKASSVIPKDLKQLRGRKNVRRMVVLWRGIKFIAKGVSDRYKIRSNKGKERGDRT